MKIFQYHHIHLIILLLDFIFTVIRNIKNVTFTGTFAIVYRRSHTARVHEKKRLQFSSETTPLIPENDVPDSCLPERRVIAEDGSLVRSLHFSCTFIENTVSTCPTLWVGTNSGLVMVLSLSIPNTMDTRQSDGIMAGQISSLSSSIVSSLLL